MGDRIPPSAHLKPSLPKHNDAEWLSKGDFDIQDTDGFKIHVKKITDIVAVARKWPDGRPKGWSISEIRTCLGDNAYDYDILLCLGWIDNLAEDHGALTRYRILDRPVKQIQNHPRAFSIKGAEPKWGKLDEQDV